MAPVLRRWYSYLTEFSVVVCGKCGFAKIVMQGVATSSCSHCGSRIDIRKSRIHFTGPAEDAREVVFHLNSSSLGRKPGGHSVSDFLETHPVFSLAEFASFFGTGEEDAERRIGLLMREGLVYSIAKDKYCVLR